MIAMQIREIEVLVIAMQIQPSWEIEEPIQLCAGTALAIVNWNQQPNRTNAAQLFEAGKRTRLVWAIARQTEMILGREMQIE